MTIADKITRLQNAKTAIAAAITTKGGTVTSGDGFEDFSTDIATIPSGITPTGNINITDTQQTDVTNYATAQVVDADLVAGNIKKDVEILGVTGTFEGGGTDYIRYISNGGHLFRDIENLPQTIVLNLDNYKGNDSYGGYWFYRSYESGQSHKATIDLTINFGKQPISMSSMFVQAYGLKSVTINGDLSKVTSYGSMFDYCSGLREINIEFDFTSASNANISNNGSNNTYITNLRFKEATLKVSCNVSKFTALNDTSLVSIANSINESAAAATITLHATPKARCSTLMGTVALDPTSTFHVFTADASGSTSLQSFITDIKGWSLA